MFCDAMQRDYGNRSQAIIKIDAFTICALQEIVIKLRVIEQVTTQRNGYA
jgi:hypothetical protein